MQNELYIFQCKECGFAYSELYDTSDRFAEFPRCSDCGSEDVAFFEGDDLPQELRDAVDEYIAKYGMPED